MTTNRGRQKSLCPFCLKPLRDCGGANCPWPPGFEQNYKQAPPLWVLSAGYSSHGKTAFTSMATLLLESLSHVWPDFSFDYMLDEYTRDAILKMRQEVDQRVSSAATQPAMPRPFLMQLKGVPTRSGRPTSRTIVMHDVAGEFFYDMENLGNYVPALTQLDVVWLLVSLSDLTNEEKPFRISDLFQAYISAMRQAKVSLKGKKVVVVFTKADLIQEDLDEEVIKYFLDDPFQSILREPQDVLHGFSLIDYMEDAEQISQLLEQFTGNPLKVPGGRNFLAMVQQEGMTAKFCALSALGQNPNRLDGRLIDRAIPYRVLDPLFWTLYLTDRGPGTGTGKKPSDDQTLRLIVDYPTNGKPPFAPEYVYNLWEAMSYHGTTLTHYLGSLRPDGQAAQRPPESGPDFARPRLLGPVLDSIPRNSRVLILTDGDVLDVDDYRADNHWRSRMLVGVSRQELRNIWHHTFRARDGDDPDQIVTMLLNLRDSGHG